MERIDRARTTDTFTSGTLKTDRFRLSPDTLTLGTEQRRRLKILLFRLRRLAVLGLLLSSAFLAALAGLR